MTLEERMSAFRKEVLEVGGLIYKRHLLDEFNDYWTETNRAKGKAQKMRHESETHFVLKMRLSRWAKNAAKDYNPYLSSHETTIEGKKRDFMKAMEPFVSQYDRTVLNGFWRHWTQPENKQVPLLLRWELEKFWSLSSRLEQWNERQQKQR